MYSQWEHGLIIILITSVKRNERFCYVINTILLSAKRYQTDAGVIRSNPDSVLFIVEGE